MKLKLLGAAATTTIAALIAMPSQQAYADECIGYYDGSSAIAFSGAARVSKHISANLAIGLVPSRGDIGARAGVRVGW